MKLTTDADLDLMQHLREQLAADTPYFWGHIMGSVAHDWSAVSVARFVQNGVLIPRTFGSYDIVVDALEKLGSAGQDTKPTGERLLQASDPEAKAFRDAEQWCTAAYAQLRYGIKAQQLTRASKQENGLGGIIVNRSRAQVGEGKRGQVLVYHAGDLQRLANRLAPEE